MRKIKDLTGQKFNSLTVLKRCTEFVSKRNVYWVVQCDCGVVKNVRGVELVNGTTKSCGCLKITYLKLRDARKYEPRIATAMKIFKGKTKDHAYSDGNLSFEEWLDLTQKPCYYCKSEPSRARNIFKAAQKWGKRGVSQKAVDQGTFIYNGLDRIDSTKPHNKNNVVPCCWSCNSAKMAMTADEFKEWLKKISSNHLYHLEKEELDEAVKMYKAQKEKDSSCLESSSELALVS